MSGKKGMKRGANLRCARGRLWQVMRRRRVFTVDEIVIPLAGVTVSNAQTFLAALIRDGYVRVERWSGDRGARGCRKVYRLVRDVGPEYPRREATP